MAGKIVTNFNGFAINLLIVGILTMFSNCNASTVVNTKLGKIRGLEETSSISQGVKYFAFKGIRYAKPPTGHLRFKAPVSMSGWEGILDATVDGHICPQFHVATNQVIGDEDCLSLNVYTTQLEDLKPVVVFIHGGGFQTGSSHSQMYGPDLLLEQNVVLVTINYRLHVFGFLNTETDGARGNAGLHDQILALRWVHDNIASFGGDPDKVTLLGEGAGAASATLLTLTSKAQGLFRNVISLGGGSGNNEQYFQKSPLESSRELVSRFECSYEDFQELENCLRQQPMEALVRQVNNMVSFFSFPRWFAPSVDNELFSQNPETLLREGKISAKVPTMIGLGRHEGAFYYPLTVNSFNEGHYEGTFIDQRLPRLLPVISELGSKLLPVTRALKKRYFTNIDLDRQSEFRPRYVELLTDLLYVRHLSRYGRFLSNHSIPVYFYLLDYQGSHSVMDAIDDTDVKMVAHGDIAQYLFTEILGEGRILPPDDLKFARETLIPIFMGFAKTGKPPSHKDLESGWPTYSESDQTVCVIGRRLSLQKDFRSTILKFWETELPKITHVKDEL